MSEQENREVVVTTRLETEVFNQLREHARLHERSISQELRLAVRRYLAEIKAPA